MHKGTCNVIQEIIVQIVSYPNLITLCVESLPNSYYLYHDMVPYSILNYLNTCSKPKLDYHGIGIALWLQNIALFTGEFFRTYYKTEMIGILSHIVECLSVGQVVEICILKQILSKMSGWNPPENLTEKMLKSLAGGPKLKIAAYNLGEDRSRTTKSSGALGSALQKKRAGEKLNFAMELAILAGQQAKALLFSESANFKVLGVLYDNLVGSMILLVDILSLQFSKADEYSSLLPSQPIVVLSQEHHLPLPLVMYIVRPGIDISKFDSIIDQLKIITPDSHIPIKFFAIFWALSLLDIRSVESQYELEIENIRNTGVTTKTQTIIDQLGTELTFLKHRQNFFADFIKKNTQIPQDCAIAIELVQKGIYPRLLCSPSDALYCACFIETIMRLQISDFPVFEIIFQCIKLILPCIHCCTEGEAINIGLFFLELLKILTMWKNGCDDGKGCPVLREMSIKDFKDKYAEYHQMIANVLADGLKSSYLVQKNSLNVINRIFSEFPNSKESAKILLVCIEPLKEVNMEDLKLIAQRVYDNLEKKFSEKKVEVQERPVEEKFLISEPVKKRKSQENQDGKGKEDIGNTSVKTGNMYSKNARPRDGSNHNHRERSIKDDGNRDGSNRKPSEPHNKDHGQRPRDNYKPKDDRDGNRERSGDYGYERTRRNDHGGNRDFNDKRGHRNIDSRKDHRY